MTAELVHDVDTTAEAAVVGGLLHLPATAAADVLDQLVDGDIADPHLNEVLRAVRDLVGAGTDPTPDFVRRALDKTRHRFPGGATPGSYLAELLTAAPPPGAMSTYLKLVNDARQLREATAVVTRLRQAISSGDVDQVLHQAAQGLASLLGDQPQRSDGEHLRSRLLRRDQLKSLPRPAPLIDGTLDQRTVALLSGRSSTGKSFVAIDWGCCIATGKSWQGRPIRAAGPVLYVAAEGAFGLDQRLSAWEQAWHHEADLFVTLPEPVNLFTGVGFGQLLDVVRDGLEGRPWQLVVFDTWARSTVGGQENNNSDSTTAFGRIDQVRQLGPTCLVIAHTDGSDSKTRGATALEDNADTVYRIKGDSGLLELDRTKRKDGPRDDRVALALRTLEVGRDLFNDSPITSCIVQNAGGQDHLLAGKAKELLSVFDDCFADSGCNKTELRNAAAMPPATFDRSLKALLRAGALTNVGTDERPRYKPGPNRD
ncbi:MAG: DnaB domain protein helicase domain protein [Frankiales bacterium]|nr:DnaB domain protein helicase domain protein [Frankiales bacterium]